MTDLNKEIWAFRLRGTTNWYIEKDIYDFGPPQRARLCTSPQSRGQVQVQIKKRFPEKCPRKVWLTGDKERRWGSGGKYSKNPDGDRKVTWKDIELVKFKMVAVETTPLPILYAPKHIKKWSKKINADRDL